MIVVDEGGVLRFTTQPDHAHLAAQILELTPLLVDLRERQLLLRATRLHDNGWQETDAAPLVLRDGRPCDFMALPWHERIALWDRATARYADTEPEVALLVVEHALALHKGLGDATQASENAAEPLLTLLHTRREHLFEELGERAEGVVALYPWLRLADVISLGLCCSWSRSIDVRLSDNWVFRLTFRAEPRVTPEVSTRPGLLTGSTRLRVPIRRVAQDRFSGTRDLLDHLLASSFEDLELRIDST